MPNPEVQCRVCDMWIPTNLDRLLTPKHTVEVKGSESNCSGGGTSVKAKRGFPKPRVEKW